MTKKGSRVRGFRNSSELYRWHLSVAGSQFSVKEAKRFEDSRVLGFEWWDRFTWLGTGNWKLQNIMYISDIYP